MAAFEVHAVPVSVGALSNATRPLFPAPSDAEGGGISVVEAHIFTGGTSSAEATLVKGTIDAGGTFVVNGTIGAAIGGTASQWAAGAMKHFEIGSDPFVDAGEWVAVVEGNVQAFNAATNVVVSYVMGR